MFNEMLILLQTKTTSQAGQQAYNVSSYERGRQICAVNWKQETKMFYIFIYF